MRALSHRYLTLLVLAVVIAVLPLLLTSNYYFRVASLVWVSAFAAIGLNILMGNAGQVSLGHAGFFGIGSYAAAIGPAHLGLAPWLSVVVGVAISAALAGHAVPMPDCESALELSYQMQVAPWWILQPDIQWIFHPGARLYGAPTLADAAVLGLRTAINL